MQHQGTRADMARTAPPFGNEPRIAHAEGEQIAHWLRQAAEILQAQGANPFRVGAYRKAADTVESTPDVRALYETQGRAGLDALPGIGPAMAAALAEMLESGRWAQLERLRGALDPATLFHTVPGVGPQLAERIHDTLGIDTLEALEVACHDGRLRQVPGVGPRRIASIRAALAEILGHARLRRPVAANPLEEPPVAMLLDVDREYRVDAGRGHLPMIAPRRFNPDHRAWLPVLHTTRGNWHFTALFSNTVHAHELDRTHDWVVLYFDDDVYPERQRTVVTETHGALLGQRVVRGREAECARLRRGGEGKAPR